MIKTVVFDLGGVVFDWNPRHLYRKLIPDEAEMEHFLSEVCTYAWHIRQDAGGSTEEATAQLVEKFPEHADLVSAFYDRFGEMLGGVYQDTVAVMDDLRQRNIPLYALSNWPAGTFHHADRHPFMQWFTGKVVSGFEGVMKPDPRIFRILLDRYGLEAASTLFIDDVEANVTGAEAVGLRGHHFRDPQTLRRFLTSQGLIG